MNEHRKISRRSKFWILSCGVMLLSGYLLFALSAERYAKCGPVWVKLIWRWSKPDQSLGSGVIRDYYYLSDQCTATVIVNDRLYLTLLENGKTSIDLVVPKWIAYSIVDGAKFILLLLVAALIALWRSAKWGKLRS